VPKKKRQRRQPRRPPSRPPVPARARRDFEPYDGYEERPGPVYKFDLSGRLVGGDGQRKRLEDQVARMVNDVRAKAGLWRLATDERLRKSARGHGADMADRDYFAHQSPDGGTPFDRMLSAGYPHGAAENIARGQQKPQEVMQAWMNSPGHRRNILHPDFKAIGVGIHMGEYGPWWTQHFGY
jgi:uncharacterized protein YkwD